MPIKTGKFRAMKEKITISMVRLDNLTITTLQAQMLRAV